VEVPMVLPSIGYMVVFHLAIHATNQPGNGLAIRKRELKYAQS